MVSISSSCDPLASASQSTGIIGVSHHSWPMSHFLTNTITWGIKFQHRNFGGTYTFKPKRGWGRIYLQIIISNQVINWSEPQIYILPGMVAHACYPSTLGGWGRLTGWDKPAQHGETPSLLKNIKISQVWWHVPVIPATQEAEAGELPEPRRQRLLWAEIAPLHSSLGNKSEIVSQKKKMSVIIVAS